MDRVRQGQFVRGERSDKRFEALLLESASIVWWTNPQGEFVEEQPYWQDYTGQSWEDHQGSRWISCVHPDDRDGVIADWKSAVESGGLYRTQGRIWSAKHQAYRAFQARGIAVRDESGRIEEWLGALSDIQDSIDAQERLRRTEEALAGNAAPARHNEVRRDESEQRYTLLVEQCVDGIFIATPDGRLEAANTAGCAMFGAPRAELLQQRISDLVVPEDRERTEAAVAGISRDGMMRSEWRCRRADGSVFIGEFVGRRSEDGRLQGVLRDVTERRRHVEHMQALNHEIAHRNKNLLSVVQALAAQTGGTDVQQFQAEFTARIKSLATSVDLLIKENWEGVSLEKLARSQLAAFSGADDHRVAISGPDIRLSSSATQLLGMALHQLATNAVRRGALSADDGQVELRWESCTSSRGKQLLRIEWREQGGPPSGRTAPTGFGTTVLKKLIEQSFDARVEMPSGDSGFVWRAVIPVQNIEPPRPVPKMARYEFQFVDHSGRIYSRSELDAESDEQAITRGKALYRIGVGYGFHVLRDGILVHTEKFPGVTFHARASHE